MPLRDCYKQTAWDIDHQPQRYRQAPTAPINRAHALRRRQFICRAYLEFFGGFLWLEITFANI